MKVAGIDIGGTKCAALIADVAGDKVEFHYRKEIPTRSDWRAVLDELASSVEDGMAKSGEKVCAVGISCGGPLDSERGVILSPPNLTGWDNVPVTEFFANRFGVSARLINDANACALAEWRFGAGKGTRNFIFMTFGTGLGAGLILDGKLYEGTNGNAGEAGHIRLRPDGPSGFGKRGSFEGFCSGAGIAKLARSVAEEEVQRGHAPSYLAGEITAKSVAEAAREGDSAALRVFAEAGERLGEGLAVLADILNPERIALGGVYMRCEDLLYDNMLKSLRRESLAASADCLTVVPAALGEKIGDYGAVAAALGNFDG